MAKNVTKKGKVNKKLNSRKKDKIDLDNEIVIGLNTNYIKPVKPITKNETEKNHGLVSKIIKAISILFLFAIAVLLIFMSPIFKLNEIIITGNDKLITSECIELSGLELGQNIYKLSKSRIKENIKQNPYVEDVVITRKLPDKIEISIKERKPTFMLELENNVFAYINNQGYILEKETSKIDTIIITGFSTSENEIEIGKRLNESDLKKIETVLKIVDSAKSNDIYKLITKINIQDKNDYILILEGEKKTAHIGDASNISTRMLYIKAILEKEKDIEGEIYINGNINIDKAFFRESI